MSAAPPMDIELLLGLHQVAVGWLDAQGNILRANAAFRAAVTTTEPHVARAMIAPDLRALRARAPAEGWSPVHEGPITIGDPSGVGRGLHGIVLASAEGLLVVAEVDERSYESVAREVVALNEEMGELQREQARTISQLSRTEQELRRALAEVRTLRGLLPICASCKRIRDEAGDWQRLETYVEAHSEARMSHGICPTCLSRELASLDAKEP